MQVKNYLNISLNTYSESATHPENSISIIICSIESQLKQFEHSPLLYDKVKIAMEKEKGKIISFFAEKQCFVVANTSDKFENWRVAGAHLYRNLQKEKTETAHITGLNNIDSKYKIAFLEGLLLSSYHFNKYKKDAKSEIINVAVSETSLSASELSDLNNLTNAVSHTKTMVNEPLNFLDALKFSEITVEAGKLFGFETEILHKKEIESLKMGGLLAVNQGSTTPPTFNIMTYKPTKAVNTKPLVLVGKGVTFDTGGYSLKVGGSMPGMKSDMAGGAAVLGIISAIAQNKLPYHVIGLVPATDNKISGNALVVDDVITMMDGTTVEVLNTDAEGRLVLADALTYAKRYNPELVIDMATLTGASAAITGSFGIAMAGNTQEQMDILKVSGENVHERLIQLPFWKEFAELLKSDIADLKNIGGPIGGATTAGKFLEHFTDYPWIHLDIAGAAHINTSSGYKQSGGTGVAVRLVYDFVQRKVEASKLN
jgi:leucyl aminopeptidase